MDKLRKSVLWAIDVMVEHAESGRPYTAVSLGTAILQGALAEPTGKEPLQVPGTSACVYPQCVSTTRTQCEAWALGACEERTGWREAMGEDVAR